MVVWDEHIFFQKIKRSVPTCYLITLLQQKGKKRGEKSFVDYDTCY